MPKITYSEGPSDYIVLPDGSELRKGQAREDVSQKDIDAVIAGLPNDYKFGSRKGKAEVADTPVGDGSAPIEEQVAQNS